MEQHFLTDPSKLRLLTDALKITPDSHTLELGAGNGSVARNLPPCRLTLVEIDAALADSLRQGFPQATVLEEDARNALERLEFDILLSNLPQALTDDILTRLEHKTFQEGVIAVHEADGLEKFQKTFVLTPLGLLEGEDFSPPQPFRSRLVHIRPRS